MPLLFVYITILSSFGTIKHESVIYIQQARNGIIAVNIPLPHYGLNMNVFFCKSTISG